ncbi:TIR-like protein FxsC [Streptomyces sp. R28]|uniref:TIR-like protein FxsC n=1 Tax=Streptomyces sp. R28 TaxID=3238628 RepID=A0AB39Q0Z1_9ACTN
MAEPGSVPDDVLREELARLLDAGGAPDADDALDVLWIARLSGLDPVDWSLLGNGTDPTRPPPPATPLPLVPQDDDPTPDTGPEPPSARLHLPGGTDGTAPAGPGGAHAIRVAQPQALPDALALTRALRPLRQTVPSTRARTLDVEATAAASGDTGLLLPILRPAPERRFSVDLLIDTGTTMKVWHRLADELRTLLARHGAFADVRAWALQTDGPEPTLAPFRRSGAQAASPVRRWRQALADPAGRRAVLVLTDGVGPSWYGTELPAALADWSVRRPVAALQVLPGRLWHRTALRTSAVRARGTETDRATIEVRSSGPLPGIARGRAGAEDRARIHWLPVLEVSGDWLSPWARLVSGRTTDWLPMRAAALTTVERPTLPASGASPSTPGEWIERFEEGYSPEAFRLVRLLAAAPLSLPVMRLVQRTMLPASTPMHLAEIFLSGLLVRRTPAAVPGEDPDSVLYDFRDGVREALLDRLTRTESLRVLERVIDGVSERVAATFGGVTDFGALLAAVAEGGGGLDGRGLPEGSRAFAEVALAVVAGVGGDHAEVVERLTRGRVRGVAPTESVPEPREERRRGWGLLSWWRRKGALEPEVGEARREGSVVAGGNIGVARTGERVPSRIPPLPEFYVRREEEASSVLRSLVGGNRDAAARGLLPMWTQCMIVGARGVGKTALAIECAQASADTFTMVRWIRAHKPDILREDLAALADDLGITLPENTLWDRLDRLFTYLSDNPGWLLIYDGVSSETFLTDERDSDPWPTWLPPPHSGSLLVTLSEGTRWWEEPYETVTLSGLTREAAVEFVRDALAPYRGEVWHEVAELADFVEIMGTHPGILAAVISNITERRLPIASFVEGLLIGRPATREFLSSLVSISREGRFVGTGVAVRPDVVLAAGFSPGPGVLQVRGPDGAEFRVVRASVVPETPKLVSIELEEAGLPAVPLAHSVESPFAAAWYEKPTGGSRTPEIKLSLASSEAVVPPAGAVVVDAGGRLCSLYSSKGVAWFVSPGLIDRIALSTGRVSHVREREPEAMPSEAPREGPLFFLSYSRAAYPASGKTHGNPEEDFFHLVSQHVMEMTDFDGESPGFMADSLTKGARWREEAYAALAEARVFVPLLSPSYFESKWCHREWSVFRWRQSLGGVIATVPVLWEPVDPTQLPREVREVQYMSSTLDSELAAVGGLRGLRESGHWSQYRRVAWAIAQTIVEVAQRRALPPVEPSLLADVRDFSEDEEP